MTDKKVKMNALETYARSGERAGAARRHGVESTARNESLWAQQAFNLESPPYRNEARQLWENSYKEGYRNGKVGL
jgi:hypothetical protein